MDRIAISSTDGAAIDEHYGRAKSFYIFSVDDDGNIRDEGPREIALPAGIPENELLDAKADLLGDVDYVLSAKIGPAAVASLARRDIGAYAHSGAIADALRSFVKRRDRIGRLAKPEREYLASCISRGGGCGGCTGRGR
jgi:predicted Fe-Mo cluster-binding NifX family protein